MWTSILIADLLILQITDAIHVGVGISDITGPAAGTPMVTFIELLMSVRLWDFKDGGS